MRGGEAQHSQHERQACAGEQQNGSSADAPSVLLFGLQVKHSLGDGRLWVCRER